ncbi:hypothetical protein PHJA_000017000 [Phtheirospermum japonicum]|uniref:Uncharacterized protein n=1 Tax=Phtheirospermum japonicum TaxID=374723 RepID=A0A830B3B4_9LAMI|nr:hypothetical protein PHJA_000017000 [Phtheirospermum japonicum]
MALTFGTASTALHPTITLISPKIPNKKIGSPSSSARTQLDLLDQLTGDGSTKLTVREQLANLVGDRDDDFSLPLGKNLKKVSAKFLTISQKRNIRRQAYLNEVSRRNDSVFFATIGAFVILPPILILGFAIATVLELEMGCARVKFYNRAWPKYLRVAIWRPKPNA